MALCVFQLMEGGEVLMRVKILMCDSEGTVDSVQTSVYIKSATCCDAKKIYDIIFTFLQHYLLYMYEMHANTV